MLAFLILIQSPHKDVAVSHVGWIRSLQVFETQTLLDPWIPFRNPWLGVLGGWRASCHPVTRRLEIMGKMAPTPRGISCEGTSPIRTQQPESMLKRAECLVWAGGRARRPLRLEDNVWRLLQPEALEGRLVGWAPEFNVFRATSRKRLATGP